MDSPIARQIEQSLHRGQHDTTITICNDILANTIASSAVDRKQVADLLTDAGLHHDAERMYKGALDLDDEAIPVLNNLAMLLEEQGRLTEAIDYYQIAIEIDPGIASVHANLANAYVLAARRQDALNHYKSALKIEPSNPSFQYNYALLLASSTCSAYDASLETDLIAMLESPAIDHDELAPLIGTLLSLKPTVRAAIQRAQADPLLADFGELCEERLLISALSRCIIPNENIETLATALRTWLERRIVAGSPLSSDETNLALAIAIQAGRTEYIWVTHSTEPLVPYPSSDNMPVGAAAVLLGRHAPSREVSSRLESSLEASQDNVLAAMALKLLFVDPAQEKKIRARLIAQTHTAATKIAAYYDQNPYPRWSSSFEFQPISAFPYFAELAEGRPLSWKPSIRPRYLVAGCGTGKHALSIGQRFSDVDVTAIDVSPASLAHAIRRCAELNIKNVDFRLTDLTDENSDLGLFDVIESVGVLHHLEEPMKGLEALRKRMKPKGLIKLGLYSKAARHPIAEFSRRYRDDGITASVDKVREARAEIRRLPPNAQLRSVLRAVDFYSLSGCRDLLFNPQEALFEITELRSMTQKAGLTYLATDIPSEERRRLSEYVRKSPQMANLSELEQWESYEKQHPMTFAGMYQMWFQC